MRLINRWLTTSLQIGMSYHTQTSEAPCKNHLMKLFFNDQCFLASSQLSYCILAFFSVFHYIVYGMHVRNRSKENAGTACH